MGDRTEPLQSDETPENPFTQNENDLSCRFIREVTAQDVENGVDMQGITWEAFNVTRDGYREVRLAEYMNYENIVPKLNNLTREDLKPVQTDGQYYKFKYTTLTHKCSIVHFQLRNLLWATTRNDVYFTNGTRIGHWNSIRKQTRFELDSQPLGRPQHSFDISTIACKYDFLLAGGLYGEYACRRLDSTTIHHDVITEDNNGITNHIDIIKSRAGPIVAVISSNDQKSRIMDLATLKFTNIYEFDWPVNCTAVSPDKSMLCVVGDDVETKIVDANSGQNITTLVGHLDYSFACCWSPDGLLIATGNQDKTTRLYDVRKMSTTLGVLGARLGAVRSLHFSEDGRYMAMAEPADFVHVFDAKTFERSQVIDIFGEIAGVSFTPDTEGLYIANADENYGCIMEFESISPVNHIENIWL
ncbi:9741_t:CDS:10 [Paraglomus brasilianum]|uniref:9741_t:CDS:1 n=1 Tax=Paraglomus brasilianum TaxID=144538 RepID=A0A9N9AD67_9GLOM|nr:9741_t:CDS:10 [Paraglomus brasilianum]